MPASQGLYGLLPWTTSPLSFQRVLNSAWHSRITPASSDTPLSSPAGVWLQAPEATFQPCRLAAGISETDPPFLKSALQSRACNREATWDLTEGSRSFSARIAFSAS